MAYVFYTAIQEALGDGKLKEPAPTKDDDYGCDKKFGSGASAGNYTSVSHLSGPWLRNMLTRPRCLPSLECV